MNRFITHGLRALLAARRSRIEQLAADGNKRAVSALAGIRELTLMLAGAQLGITMCSLGLGAEREVSRQFKLSGLEEDRVYTDWVAPFVEGTSLTAQALFVSSSPRRTVSSLVSRA